MRNNKFFTLKQLEEIDNLGPTVYFYVCPGVKEIVSFLDDDAEEIDDSDIIED